MGVPDELLPGHMVLAGPGEPDLLHLHTSIVPQSRARTPGADEITAADVDFEGLIVASTHGSPWNYDTYVPIVFAGAGLEPAIVDRRVLTVDIAATLAAYLGIKAPSGSVGEPLQEVVGD